MRFIRLVKHGKVGHAHEKRKKAQEWEAVEKYAKRGLVQKKWGALLGRRGQRYEGNKVRRLKINSLNETKVWYLDQVFIAQSTI